MGECRLYFDRAKPKDEKQNAQKGSLGMDHQRRLNHVSPEEQRGKKTGTARRDQVNRKKKKIRTRERPNGKKRASHSQIIYTRKKFSTTNRGKKEKDSFKRRKEKGRRVEIDLESRIGARLEEELIEEVGR